MGFSVNVRTLADCTKKTKKDGCPRGILYICTKPEDGGRLNEMMLEVRLTEKARKQLVDICLGRDPEAELEAELVT